jgi:predicted nucleotidyltransferase component of viral defense system
MEMISENKLRYIAGMKGLNLIYIEKDYFLTVFLYLTKGIRGIYLKGGTALNKIFLDHARLSEDLDFAADRPVREIRNELERVVKNSGFFTRIRADKTTKDFVRYLIYYRSYFQAESFIIADVNRKASIHLKPEKRKMPNFYGLDFSISTLNIREIIAEKVRALITRNQPRDYFDAYFILRKHHVDMKLVKMKLKEAKETFDTKRIFRNANKIYSRWDSDISPLTNKKLGYMECIKALKNKFG